MQFGIYEILQKVSEEKTAANQIDVLHKYDNPTLRKILQLVFDPNVSFLLPKKINYTPNKLPDCQNVLYTEAKKLYLFIKDGHPTLDQTKREKLFKVLLGNLNANDAILMMAVKDKKLPFANIRRRTIEKAFPGLIPHE